MPRSTSPELLDRPQDVGSSLAGNLDDLRRINRWLGGVGLTARGIERLSLNLQSGRTLSLLDVATGAGDVPASLVEWARRRGVRLFAVGLDVSPVILAHAIPRSSVQPVVGDGRSLPFADRSFDVVISCLALHHLSPVEAVMCLQEMRRVARCGVVVNDLIRGWIPLAGAWLTSRAFTNNPLTRNDAPLSVRRAYTRDELADLAAAAGFESVEFLGFLGSRVAMVARVTA